MNFFKKAALILILPLISATIFLPVTVGAQSTAAQQACDGLELTGAECDTGADAEVGGILKTVINIFSLIVGVAAVIMIIVGGLRYITSGGDATSTKGAKDTIIYAIIGLVIVALAQVIVRFVLTKV